MGGLLAADDIVVYCLSDDGGLSAPEHRSAYRLWINLRGESALPRWRALRPDQLAPLMPFVLLVDDLGARRDYQVKLAGSLVDAVLGGSLTGQSLSRLSDQDWVPFLMSGIETATTEGKPTLVTRRLIETATRSQKLATLFLPFSHDDADCRIILAINTIEQG